MAQIINTNMSALNAQRNLNRSQAAGMQAMQRLSSGLRINSAKDDAAGLGISDRMSSQIRGQNQAIRNANDGISMVQTGDGALAEMTNNLQRIRELAVQSSNVTNTAADRAAIDLEVQQRLSEIDRTASTTSFNGQKLLNGNMGDAKFQIGANAGEVIKLGLGTDVRVAASGKVATTTSGTMGAGAIDGHISSSLTAGVSPTTINFSAPGTTDSAGHINIGTAVTNFAAATTYVAGKNTSSATLNATNFSTAGTAQVDGKAVVGASGMTKFDYSGAGNMAQFDVTIGANTASITLSANYTNMAGLATEIQNQLRATTGMSAVTVTQAAGNLTITNTGSTTAVTLSNQDANASAATADFDVVTSTAGGAAVATTNASFSIDGTSITLNGNDTTQASVVAEINTKIQALTSGSIFADKANYVASLDASNKLVITHGGTNTTAVVISNADANAATAGIVNSSGTAGTAASAGNAATMSIDGITVNLNQDYGSLTNVAGAIQAQLTTAGAAITVTNTAGEMLIKRNTLGASSAAINITTTDANAIAAFKYDTDADGLALDGGGGAALVSGTSGGIAGTYSTDGGAANFTVDGKAIALTANYASRAALADGIRTQLGAGYSVNTGVNGVNQQSVTGTPPTGASAALDKDYTLAANGPASFTIDGKVITLDTNASAAGGGIAAIQAKLNAGTNSNITVAFDANNGNKLTFTRTGAGANGALQTSAVAITASDAKAQALGIADSNGLTGTVSNQIQITKNGSTTAINIYNSDANATAAGFGVASGVAGTAGGSVSLANLTINGTSLAGSFTSTQAVADKINSDVTGVYASVSSGALKLTSASAITLGGAEAGTLGGSFATGVKAANSGSLSTANTLTVDGALDTIQRVDNALSTVTTLRSTLGAVQNRFQSVIANLESTSENLSAARSRIQDADFAAESAELSRTQVLQQAGTAMLAQANQSSQGVMALLR